MTWDDLRKYIDVTSLKIEESDWIYAERVILGEYRRLTRGLEITPLHDDAHDECLADILQAMNRRAIMIDGLDGDYANLKIGSVSVSGPTVTRDDIEKEYETSVRDAIRRHYQVYRGAHQHRQEEEA